MAQSYPIKHIITITITITVIVENIITFTDKQWKREG